MDNPWGDMKIVTVFESRFDCCAKKKDVTPHRYHAVTESEYEFDPDITLYPLCQICQEHAIAYLQEEDRFMCERHFRSSVLHGKDSYIDERLSTNYSAGCQVCRERTIYRSVNRCSGKVRDFYGGMGGVHKTDSGISYQVDIVPGYHRCSRNGGSDQSLDIDGRTYCHQHRPPYRHYAAGCQVCREFADRCSDGRWVCSRCRDIQTKSILRREAKIARYLVKQKAALKKGKRKYIWLKRYLKQSWKVEASL